VGINDTDELGDSKATLEETQKVDAIIKKAVIEIKKEFHKHLEI